MIYIASPVAMMVGIRQRKGVQYLLDHDATSPESAIRFSPEQVKEFWLSERTLLFPSIDQIQRTEDGKFWIDVEKRKRFIRFKNAILALVILGCLIIILGALKIYFTILSIPSF